MVKEERLELILSQLAKDSKVQFAELSHLLNVSEDTVRRDIKELNEQGLLRAVRGGAISNSSVPHHYRDREKYDVGQKNLIAEKAIPFIKNGQTIFMDGGTSVLAVAQMMPKDLKVTVVTNSFPVADVLEDHPNADVIFAGGRLYKTAFTTIGHETIQTIRNVRANLYFMGVSSLHTQGLTGKSYEDVQVKKTMAEMSTQIVALSTLAKINTSQAFYICPVTNIHAIITEADPNSEELDAYRSMGIQLI
ncbi:DeoR faimly transcriptional regulator [Flavobacterium akiainvivens]|uniref:DeoR faimly transcriptional regulator n=1 Tax=Flavobacterium akiainvivens TaxID=1202724 RepID=A0A0M8MCP2_9FLAO|nr:DeoR/GlpR family DNA-binding transcription regulator [Flavobacterium akiainvivens]KOS07415.1 DeoR faimly transcriptional regulator [Flavobacterium akiainvivens]SFQ47875.1 transcriptional regulator, DeoR family [Flavobacterium akiainvivens]